MIWHHKSPIAFNLFLVLVQCFHGLWISLTCHNNKWSRKPLVNKSLKHFYLKLANPGTLSTLMRVVIQDFLPDLFQNYVMLNYRYDKSILSLCGGFQQFIKLLI